MSQQGISKNGDRKQTDGARIGMAEFINRRQNFRQQ